VNTELVELKLQLGGQRKKIPSRLQILAQKLRETRVFQKKSPVFIIINTSDFIIGIFLIFVFKKAGSDT
jgi:hypothetical protein